MNKKEDYTGETKKATKHRMYEHHIIHLKDAKQSTAWDREETDEPERQGGVRRSQRNAGKTKINYKNLGFPEFPVQIFWNFFFVLGEASS